MFKILKNNIFNFFNIKKDLNKKNNCDILDRCLKTNNLLDNCLKTSERISKNLDINNYLITQLENKLNKSLDSKKELLLQLDKLFNIKN